MGQNPERLEIGHCAGLVRVTWRRYLYTGGGRPAALYVGIYQAEISQRRCVMKTCLH